MENTRSLCDGHAGKSSAGKSSAGKSSGVLYSIQYNTNFICEDEGCTVKNTRLYCLQCVPY
jgi:hypothetical protein